MKIKLLRNIVFSIFFSFAIVGLTSITALSSQAGLADNIFRLHIIANSDSAEDQAIKLTVRDKIIAELGADLYNLGKVEKIANKQLKASGVSYKAKAEIGNFPFPEKRYGDIVMPAGRYNAIRITLGSGEGENWWCCLYPELCISGTKAEFSPEAKEILKANLPEDEYNLITQKAPLKSRFLEWIGGM